MPLYDMRCPVCGAKVERFVRLAQFEIPQDCANCVGILEYLPSAPSFNFKWVPGKETGVYRYDYGIYATHDLTVPGKMDRLKKDGVIRDPFDHGPSPLPYAPGGRETVEEAIS